MANRDESPNPRLDFVRDTIKAVLEIAFILFIVSLVFIYGYVSLHSIFDVSDLPINPERFNQVWTSISGIVGTIVGWMIRELTSGKSGIAEQEHLKKSHAMRENDLLQEMNSLRDGLREWYEAANKKDNEIMQLKSEMEVMSTLNKNKEDK